MKQNKVKTKLNMYICIYIYTHFTLICLQQNTKRDATIQRIFAEGPQQAESLYADFDVLHV